ncbi:MAG: 13E12 repeat family protein [Mycobacterium sp.]|nr:13E12 repeat family protein [Mycobacterium sp.]
MFDTLSESELKAVMAEALRTERVAVARRILAAGRLCRRMGAADRDVAAARIANQLGISRGRAFAQMRCGVQLLERLPALAAVFAAGEVELRVVAAAGFPTQPITDAGLPARVDHKLARCAPGWNELSREEVVVAVDRNIAADVRPPATAA